MDPLEFLETCNRLAATSPRADADNRTILSRLYYAFFLTLRDGLASKDAGFGANIKNAGSDHALVRRYLSGRRISPSGAESNQPSLRVPWYERYNDFFRWRDIADYEMNRSQQELSKKVEELIADASSLRPYIESLVR